MTTNINSLYVNNDNIIGAKKLSGKSQSNGINVTVPDALPAFSLNQLLKERDLKTDTYRKNVVLPKKKDRTFRNLLVLSTLLYVIIPRLKFKK